MSNNRDVKLVVKARDEASAVLKQIQKAINEHDRTVANSGAKSKTLTSGLASLTQEAGRLSVTLAKAKGRVEFAKQLEVIGAAATKMGSEFVATQAKLQSATRETTKAKNQLDAYRAGAEALNVALKSEREELAKVNNAIASHESALRKGKDSIAKYGGQIEAAEAKAASLRQTLGGLKVKQSELAAADKQSETSIKRLTDRLGELRAAREEERRTAVPRVSVKAGFTAANREAAIGAKTARLANFDTEIASVQSQVDALSAARAKSAQPLKDVNERIRSIEKEIESTLKLDRARKELFKAESKVTGAQSALNKARVERDQLTAAIKRSETTIQAVNAAMEKSRNDLSNFSANERAARAEAEKLSAALETTTAALKEMQASGENAGMGKALRDIERMEKALLRVAQRHREIADLAARQSRYNDGAGGVAQSGQAAQLRRLNDQLRQSEADAEAFRKKMAEIRQEVANLRMSPRIKSELQEMQRYLNAAEADARDLRQEINNIGIKGSGSLRNMVSAWKTHNAETRTALSLYQRIRGQVLSMIGAYAGIYGVVQLVQSVTQAYMDQEAALSRLGVVFDGNQGRMRTEMDWLRREANRLGIEFGVMADEYTKFAVAANMSGYSESGIRKLFTAISEAGRVNKLDMEQIKGTFLAVQQMVSKNKVGAEELRQQLGERLPGAVTLMAEALGVTTAQLDEMMKKGEVLASEENMLKFADTLNEKFGKQLPQALETFTTEWGRLQNTIFNARVTIGKGGLIDALTEVMRNLNEFAGSKEGVEFFLSLGSAMGKVASWIPTLVKNIETIIKVIGLLIAIPAAKWFLGIIDDVRSFIRWTGMLNFTLAGSGAAFTAWQASVATASGVAGKATAILRGLRAVIMTLGPVGLGIGALAMVGTYLTDWGSGVDSIVEAQTQHQRIMDKILAQYEEAKGKTYDWRDAVEEGNVAELAANQKEIFAAAREQNDKAFNSLARNNDLVTLANHPDQDRRFDGVPKELQAKFLEDFRAIYEGIDKLSKEEIEKIIDNIDELMKVIPDSGIRESLGNVRAQLTKSIEVNTDVSRAITLLREFGYEVVDAANHAERFPTSLEEMTGAVEESNRAFEAAEAAVQDKFIRPLREALEEAGAFKSGIKGADLEATMTDPFTGANTTIGEMITLLQALQEDVPMLAQMFINLGGSDVMGALDALKNKLGQIPGFGGLLTAMLGSAGGENSLGVTPNGSLLAAAQRYDGMHQRDEEDRESLTALMGVDPQAIAWCAAFVNAVVKQSGIKGTGSNMARSFLEWGDKVKGGEESVGDIIILRRGSDDTKGHVGFFQGYDQNGNPLVYGGNQSGGVNTKAFRREDILGFRRPLTSNEQTVADWEAQNEADRDAAKEAERKRLEAEKELLAKKEALDLAKEQLELETMRTNGQERAAFIEEKIAAFKRSHKNVTEQELALLREQYGQMYDLQNLKSKDEKLKEEEKKHQEEINRLETERNALLEQRKHYEEAGDTGKVAEIDKRLVDINAQLQAAIDRFIAFWKAAGGPESAGAIAQLEAAKLGLKETGKEALITAEQINQQWAGGMSDALSKFAEAVANGKNGFKSLRDAFLSFVGDFLIGIGKMIVQQTLLNALQGMGPAGGGGFGGMLLRGLGGITTGLFHTGKAAGATAGGLNRTVPAAAFIGAPRFHGGKLPGLRTGEMAAIIEQEEEVLTAAHPRHADNFARTVANMTGGGGEGGGVTVVNAIDPASFVEQGLSAPAGGRALMNYMRANKAAIKRTLA